MSGLYWISNFYISRALQGHGLGSATLDTIESIATAEPLKAKTLALNAIDKYDPGREEKYEALGLPIPPVSWGGVGEERECGWLMEYSFLIRSGMRRGVIGFIILWRKRSPRLTRRGRRGTGMLCI